MTATRRLTLALVCAGAVAFVAGLAWAAVLGVDAVLLVGLLVSGLLCAWSATLGWLVSRAVPGNPVGPLLAAIGLAPVLVFSIEVITDRQAVRPVWGGEVLVALSQGDWVLLYLPIALLLLVFPAGHLLSRRWRAVVAVLVANAVLFDVLAAFSDEYLPPNQDAPHPFGTAPPAVGVIGAASALLLLPLLVLCTVSLFLRYRRSDARARAQVKWLGLAALALPLTLLACWASYLIFGSADQLVTVGLAVLYAAVPAATAVAVIRHDLYDVDRVIAATVTHAALSAALLLLFAATSFAGGILLGGRSEVTAVVATIVCALAVTPLRRRLQQLVDRRLYPARRAVLAAVDRLRRAVDAVQGRPEQLEDVLRAALADPTLEVGYLVPGEQLPVRADAGPLSARPDGQSVPVRLGDNEIGVVQTSSGASRELLVEVAAAAAPVVEVVRLRLELRRALQEVEASRARLLSVGYEERRRLERDLHDGAQQRLVSLGMALRVAQRRLSSGNGAAVDVDGLLDQAVAELGTVVSELRELANGIRPSCLDDGLIPALSALATSLPIPMDLEVSHDVLAHAGLPADVETTAYYVVAEAVTNAVKHSGAARLRLAVHVDDGRVHVRVTDDGAGGAAVRPGSGLAGLLDRVRAHGGHLQVLSTVDAGTTVEAVLPCAS